MPTSDPEAILEELDPEQREVATTFGRPVAVIAGAGTGKTRAITHRIAYAGVAGEYDLDAVLAVTFTTRAATEMRSRLRTLGAHRVQVHTFHAAALKQAQHFWPRVYGVPLPDISANRLAVLADVSASLGLSLDSGTLRDLSTDITWAKVNNISADAYAAMASPRGRVHPGLPSGTVERVMRAYEAANRRAKVIDFDDILLCTVALLADHPEAAAEVRHRYQHFVVDEYQDVSPIQQALLDLWLGGRGDVCVVGDPGQTIHSFAGADARFLTGFRTRYPHAAVLELVRNYRSSPEIVVAANRVSRQASSSSVTLLATRPPGPPVVLASAAHDAQEAQDTAAWLRSLKASGLAYAEMAVLYRSHAQASLFADALRAEGIPFALRTGEGGGERDSESANARSADADAVTLSTLHAAKGVEWDAVALVGLHEGALPIAMAAGAQEVAEEQRLFYVGLTRARLHLRLSWSAGRTADSRSRSASRFLAALEALGERSAVAVQPRRRPRSRLSSVCRQCKEPLTSAAEHKVGRHLECPSDYDGATLQRLKEWRMEQALEQAVPAFCIVTDATLTAIAESRPTSEADLTRISGIGLRKAERYGADILAILALEGASTNPVAQLTRP